VVKSHKKIGGIQKLRFGDREFFDSDDLQKFLGWHRFFYEELLCLPGQNGNLSVTFEKKLNTGGHYSHFGEVNRQNRA
jgi:hypothetical protein